MRTPLKRVQSSESEVFLTFDDGPSPGTTEAVLELLKTHGGKATFFVIGQQATKNRSVLNEILSQGHTIGNHSWDHAYGHYFQKKNHLKSWVMDSQNRLADLIGQDPVAFRSPAGIVTPPLKEAMQELNVPWVHWSQRFFDTNVPLSWMLPWSRITQGDIILLHDRQKKTLKASFLKSLAGMLTDLQDKGFDFPPLSKEKFSYDC